ncbi:UNVERIFIED_CONTAM: hypothetical protein H355_006161, partial [Colinus virginianus]
ETESGRGIMEEPELTLVSSNDISIAESDTEHMNQEKRSEGKTKDPACVDRSAISVLPETSTFSTQSRDQSTFLEVRTSDLSIQRGNLMASPETSKPNVTSEECFKENITVEQIRVNILQGMHWNVRVSKGGFFAESEKRLDFSFSVMLLESVSAPGSLQESFLKRKKDFIQKSLKRVEEIKQRERKTEKPEGRQLQRRKPETLSRQKECRLIPGKKGAVVHQLKKVGEVKVSSPEDRKAREAEMYQRTSRLYNQLSEVKTRKEEKTRQETYAENRERAKEFQKVKQSLLAP